MRRISLKRFIEGGPPKFDKHKINHNNLKSGMILKIPILIIMFRVWDRSYARLAIANKPEEVIPWANIKRMAPMTAIVL